MRTPSYVDRVWDAGAALREQTPAERRRAVSAPLRWVLRNRPIRVEVRGLFAQGQSYPQIGAVYAMLMSAHHHYLVVVEEPADAARWHAWLDEQALRPECANLRRQKSVLEECASAVLGDQWDAVAKAIYDAHILSGAGWPLRNVIHAACASTQVDADAKLHQLAKIRGRRALLLDPLRERVTLDRWLWKPCSDHGRGRDDCACEVHGNGVRPGNAPSDMLSWVIAGGDGRQRGAAPCDVAWLLDLYDAADEARTPIWVERLGALPRHVPAGWGAPCRPDGITHPSGGAPAEWNFTRARLRLSGARERPAGW